MRVSDRREDVDFDFVHQFLSEQSIWATGVGRNTLKRALDYSLCFSVFKDDRQIGFARVVTDCATFAWIDDVFVDPDERGAGVPHHLLNAIVDHESLASVASWWLSSSNPVARSLFVKHGFEEPPRERLMKLMARPKQQSESYRD